MEKPTIEVVLQALDTLHSSQEMDASHRAKANQWLTDLTQSVHAWEIADQLLLLKRDMVTSHFAAQTMQSKVRYAFHELPPNTHTALRDSLLNHLTSLCEAPSTIIRQVAMALVDLALLMGTWTTVVDDLIVRFRGNVSTVRVLLDVLIILPEEVNNRYLHLGENRRKQLTSLLSGNAPQVLTLLTACLSSCPDNDEIGTRVFACLGSWAQLRGFPGEMLVSSTLISTLFDTLTKLDVNDKLYDALTDALCALLFMCEMVDSYPTLSLTLKTKVLELLPVFQAAKQLEDLDRAYCLCRIFTELAESLLNYTIHQPHTDMGDLHMLDLLLECASHPDYEVVEITFNVWFRLGEELLRMKEPELCEMFRPYVQRLISALCIHCQLDEDMDKTKVPDDNDDLISFRENVVELIRDTAFLCGSLNCFAELYANICKPGTAWNVSEACLFVMYAVAPSIRVDESEVLPFAVPVLLSIPPTTHYTVRATTLRLVAELAGWINEHPDTLDVVLSFIHTSLSMRPVASEAANAVRSVCEKCRSRMGEHFQGLVQIIEAADNLGIRNESIVGLLKGATKVLSEMDGPTVSRGLLSLTTMLLQPLSHVGVDAKLDPCVCVDRLAAVFRACSVRVSERAEHPAKPAMTAAWPALSRVLTAYQEQSRVIERTCRCVRFMLRCSSLAAADLLTDIVTVSITIYRAHHHSCFLYLGSIIVDEYGSQSVYHEGLATMLTVYAEVSLPLLTGATGLLDHPDTIDDLFRLCARYLERCPILFLSSNVASTVIQCALASSTLDHRDAFSSVMKFFRDLLRLPRQEHLSEEERQACTPTVLSFITQQGQLLIDGLVSGFVNLRAYMTQESAEVLWEMLECTREHTCVLLKTAVAQLPETCRAQITEEQQTKFVTSVARCTDVDELFPVIKSLTRLYR